MFGRAGAEGKPPRLVRRLHDPRSVCRTGAAGGAAIGSGPSIVAAWGAGEKTVGADKAYHRRNFAAACRKQSIAPHVACKEGVNIPSWDGRRTRARSSYRLSQRIRKQVEEIFRGIKTVGGLRRSRYRGRERMQAWGYFVVAASNLLRMARLSLAGA